ncbi:MAG: TauD/TfdA family dioxygenase [Reyranella sp.]|nr:TauD/TfdA family dioxygenase [Reyranella sp.]MBL6651685.1 TauD/TfdA family dioxygenase [Reyranella sp.]
MAEILNEIVRDSSAWYGPDLANDTSWIVHLQPSHLAEIGAAMEQVSRRGLAFAALTRDDFPLPTLGPSLRAWQEEVVNGRGFYVLRGLNSHDYSDEEVGTIFWAMGLHLGQAVTQNPRGDLLGHVYDHGRKYGQIDVRGYETNAHLPFHTDSGDVVGLLCLRPSTSGGLSSVVSAVTIHNEILKRHPEYLAPLYRGFHYIRREAALTESPVTPHRLPVFGVRDGKLSVRLIRNQINAAASKSGVPLEPIEKAALDLVDALAYDPAVHLDMDLQQGDIQFCNNYTILHSRTAFEDHPEPERRRHMIRLWLTMDQRRPLADGFPPQNGYGDRQLIASALQAASRPADAAGIGNPR